MTNDDKQALLSVITRMEHTTKETLSPDDYWAIVALAQDVCAPEFVTEYFANKAVCSGDDDTYDEYGVNTKNSFNTKESS